MEVDYTYLTAEQKEEYGLNDVIFTLGFDEEDRMIEEYDPYVSGDSISNISYDLDRKRVSGFYEVKFHQYVDDLTIDDSPIEGKNGALLVKCKFCKKYFKPKRSSVLNRISALNCKTSFGTENNFYCSTDCKKKCPVYKSHGAIPDSGKRDAAYSIQAKEIALELADNRCEICGSEDDLEAHHIVPLKISPIEAYDTNNLVVLCKTCHKEKGHSDRKCTTGYLANC